MKTHKTSIQPILDVLVEYSAYKGCRGHCDKYGAPEEPDDPPSLEINHVWLVAASKTNKDIDIVDFLDDSEIEELTADIEAELMEEPPDFDDSPPHHD